MTSALTLTDDTYFSNNNDGIKRLYGTISCTNPYTALGDAITVSSYFKTKFHGGNVMAVGPSVAVALTGTGRMGTFIADNSSTTTVLFKLFNVGLSGTASAGLFVDNTVANISGLTVMVCLEGY